MSDERPESLAAQAAAWVPPWERTPRPPDAAYAAGERAKSDDDDLDDDLDPLFAGPDPAAAGPSAEAELPGEPVPDEEPVTVDAPRELPGDEEPDPTDIGIGPDLPVPGAIEEAAEHEDEPSTVVDAPLPPDGDDAGDVFDHAADDDVTDDAEVDLPFTEEVPGPEADDEPADDDPAALATSTRPAALAESTASVAEPSGDPAATDPRTDSGPASASGARADAGGAPEPADRVSDQDDSAGAGAAPAGAAPAGAASAGAASAGAGAVRIEADAVRDDIDFAEIVAQVDAGDLAGARGDEEPPADAQPLFGLGRTGAGADDEAAEQPVKPEPRRRKAEPAPGEPPAAGVPAQGRRRRGAAVAVAEPEERTDDEVDLKPLDDQEMRAALEAILLVVDEPVAEMQLAQIMEQPTERVATMLEDISARYTAAGHGFDLRRVAGGWRLYTRPEYAPYVERFVLDGQSVKLTQAALETLAVVAYKQPVTRSRISAIRGVNCDGVMRTLVTRGLIEECGTEAETGAFLYRTTGLFLEKLGLNSVDQLPPLAPFLPDDVEEVLDASG